MQQTLLPVHAYAIAATVGPRDLDRLFPPYAERVKVAKTHVVVRYRELLSFVGRGMVTRTQVVHASFKTTSSSWSTLHGTRVQSCSSSQSCCSSR